MDQGDFEGSLVLEKLAEVGKVDDFFEAIDSDNFKKAKSLMLMANIEDEIIMMVLKKMAGSEHGY